MEHEMKRRDLEFLSDFLEELEWKTDLIGEDTPYPSLAAVLTMDEDYDAVFDECLNGSEGLCRDSSFYLYRSAGGRF